MDGVQRVMQRGWKKLKGRNTEGSPLGGSRDVGGLEGSKIPGRAPVVAYLALLEQRGWGASTRGPCTILSPTHSPHLGASSVEGLHATE